MLTLAIFGGSPLRTIRHPPFEAPWPRVDANDRRVVMEMLDGVKFSSSVCPAIEEFEEEYAKSVGTRYALACGSGTAALHMALTAVGVEPGDEVIIPALGCMSTGLAVMQCGAIPVFADIDAATFNIDPESVQSKISSSTKAILAVDLHGLPADYERLRGIANRHGLFLLADAAQAFGAKVRGKTVGSLADVTCISMMPQKQLATCGEGGAMSTDSLHIRNAATRVQAAGTVVLPDGSMAYNALTLGWNYKLSVLQAAFARQQLRRAHAYAERFFRNGTYLASKLNELPGLIPPRIPDGATHVFHMFRYGVDPLALGYEDIHPGMFAEVVSQALRAEGLPVRFFQTAPTPMMAPFHEMETFGLRRPGNRNYKWLYRAADYPNTLQVLETTRCIGRVGSCGPQYFWNEAIMNLYIQGFLKLWDNIPRLVDMTRRLEYCPPWSNTNPSSRGTWVSYRG